MPRWTVLFHLGIFLLLPLLGFEKVRALSLVSYAPQEAFALRLDSHMARLNDVHVKVCFSHEEDSPALSECQGETWNGRDWLKRSEPWRDFPVVSGQFVIARSEAFLPYVHIVTRRIDGKGSSRVVATYATQAINPVRRVRVVAPRNEIVSVMDRGITRYLPVFDGEAIVWTESDSIGVGAYSLDESSQAIQFYALTDVGSYTVVLEPLPPKPDYKPVFHVPDALTVGEAISLEVTFEQPYFGVIEWQSNGERLAVNSDHTLSFTPQTHGDIRFTVRAVASNEEATAQRVVHMPKAVRIEEILPNPEGNDRQGEYIDIENHSADTALLHNWSMVRRDTQTKHLLSASPLPSQSEQRVSFSNKLLNSGGTYDLVDSHGGIVDTITYGKVDEGEVIVKKGVETYRTNEQIDLPEKSEEDTLITLQGEVLVPQGRTITMQAGSEAVRVVLHPSYTVPKPRLRKGDTITVAGYWRRSRTGRYLSVRHDGTLRVLATVPVPTKILSPPPIRITQGSVIENPTAFSSLQLASNLQPVTAHVTDVTLPAVYWRWVISLVISLGMTLCVVRRARYLEGVP